MFPELFLIPGLPLIGFAVNIIFGRHLGRISSWITVITLTASCVITLALADEVFHGGWITMHWMWLATNEPLWRVGFAIDGLSWFMLFIVTFIGTVIAIYSLGYMRDDPRFSRYFA